MKIKQLKKFLRDEFNQELITQGTQDEIVFTGDSSEQKDSPPVIEDCAPGDIQLDSVLTISQIQKDNSIKSFDFRVVDVWLKPTKMFTIVNVAKKKEQKNFWMLFYTDGCYFIKKGLNGAITVHCQVKNKPEET